MDGSNVRKNPFANSANNANQNNMNQNNINQSQMNQNNMNKGPVDNFSGNFNNFQQQQNSTNPPPKKSGNLPPTKSNINKEFEGNQFTQNAPSNQRAFNNQNIQNQNNDTEKILEEYENIKWLNASKGYVRPTTER